jgi:hypothetical protein
MSNCFLLEELSIPFALDPLEHGSGVVTMKLVTPVNKCGFFSSTLTVIFSSV